jgi:predicted PurR-regulated permease PerM
MEQTAASPPSAWPPRRVALATLVVVAILIAFWLLFRFRLVFFSLFTAIVLSTAIEPLVNRLTRWGLSRTVSVTIISLVALLAVVVLIMTIAPLLVEQWATITSLLSGWYRDLREMLLDSPSLLVRRIVRQLPAFLPLSLPAPSLEEAVEEESIDLVQQAFDIGSALLRNLLVVLAVGLLSVFWILEGERATRLFLLAFPATRRENVRAFLAEINQKVGAYTRGLVILSLIIGGMALVSYLIIGLPNALFLAIIAGIMEAVPLVGPLLGAIPAVMIAVSTDPSKLIWVILATLIFQTLENNLIVPRVMDRAVGVNPVASLLAFIAFGTIFGFVGALLAIPLAAVIQITLQRLLFRPNPTEQTPPVRRDAIGTLRYEAQDLVQDVRKQVREKEVATDARTDQVEDAIESIIQDLDSILALAESESPDGSTGTGQGSRQMRGTGEAPK